MDASYPRLTGVLTSVLLAACAAPHVPEQGANMSHVAPSEPNKLLVKRYYEEFLNQSRADVLPEILAPDYVDHSSGRIGPSGPLPGAERVRAAFEGLHFRVIELIAEEDRVAARWVYTGKFVAPFAGQPPTGKEHEQPGMHMFRVQGGKISEGWLAVEPGAFGPRPPANL